MLKIYFISIMYIVESTGFYAKVEIRKELISYLEKSIKVSLFACSI